MAYSRSDLLQLVVTENASDLHLRVDCPPVIRLHGVLHRVEGPILTPEDTEELAHSITSEGGAPRPTVVERLAARAAVPPPGP